MKRPLRRAKAANVELATDVVIVGAGMAGATLALGLAQGGLDCVLVDALPYDARVAPSFDGRASAISFAAWRQWRALAAADSLDPHAQRIEQIMVTDGRRPGAAAHSPTGTWLRFDSAEIADRTSGEPLGYMIENRQIRSGLAQAILTAKVQVAAPAKVISITREAGGVQVALEDGRRVRARLIVGADGRGSLVRRDAGIGTAGWDYGDTGVVATVRVERDHQGVAYEHFLPSGPFAILPLTDNRASLVWTEKTARGRALMAAPQEAFESHLTRRFGGFLGPVQMGGPRFAYPLGLQLADSLTGPRTALVGDAAHCVHPIAGQGLNMGLKDAAALAQVLIEAARLGEDIGGDAVLGRYARWRRVDNLGVALATDVFTRLFANDNPLIRATRGLGMAVVNRLGPARRLFMAEAGGASGDLPRLLRGHAI
jgi:2-octaprenyl-6-methoxyphenol hydroxylase